MIASGYDDSVFKLIDEKTGKEVNVGDTVITFRDEPAVLKAGYPPHKPNSEGHVTTDLGYHYAGVYGLKWQLVATL